MIAKSRLSSFETVTFATLRSPPQDEGGLFYFFARSGARSL